MFTYYDDQKTFDLCINWSRGYKEKRNKKQRKEKRKKIIDKSRLYIISGGISSKWKGMQMEKNAQCCHVVDTGPLTVYIPVKPVNFCHPFINEYFVYILWKYLEVVGKESTR